MKKSIGDNMIPKDWTFERGLELVKKAGYNGIELARRSPVVSDEHYRRRTASCLTRMNQLQQRLFSLLELQRYAKGVLSQSS